MNPPTNDSISSAVDFFVEGFEAAWEADLLPAIEEFLPPEAHPAHLNILVELARIDLERQWRRGARPELSAYLARFPALAADQEGRGQLAFEDYRQRLQRGEAPPRGRVSGPVRRRDRRLARVRRRVAAAGRRPRGGRPGPRSPSGVRTLPDS